ncbi:sulfatase-like hydrolase/transferase [Maridesulfovibrio sp.]|uniref:sulfatase-like hydrolase/transferase n=1 Tax=Maridesulfovibrio sp. TaxID=2795000 RepID=UPI0029F596CC|nr:sulfatase-like hydrolase/transferase [Maridesulfovibrio sp.]
MKNIIWIVIDTLRSDMLASCLSDRAQYNELDEILEQGAIFTDVMTCGGSTRNSAPAYFASLRPGLTGMTEQGVQILREFKGDVLTITEHFKHHGYNTFRWADSNLDSCQPKRGFDVYEAGYPGIRNAPHMNYNNPKRADFVRRVRQSKKPFFANFHLYFIHDFGGMMRSSWSTEEYLNVISAQAQDLRSLWEQLAPGPDDIAVITSDHGCILDQDYIEYDKKIAWGFADSKTRVFASFIGEDIKPAKHHELVRSIDIAPTLLDLALGKDMKAQGVSLKETLHGGPVPELFGIAERSDHSNRTAITTYACVRKNRWALYLNDGVPNALYNNSEGEFVKNYIGAKPEIQDELYDFYKKTVLDGPQSARELYGQKGLAIEDIRGKIEASILLPVFSWSDETRLAVEALLDQLLLTELILLDADESDEVAENIREKYNDRLFLHYVDAKEMSLQQMLNRGLELAKGPFTVTASPDCQYTENFCYSQREVFLTEPDTALTYPNLKRFIHDRREMEYIGNEICLDEIMFSRLGSLFEHNAATAAFSLPHFNEIGACAMFKTETLRNAGGFASSSADTLGRTWHKLKRHGKIKHVNKGLVISSDPTVLRPCISGQERKQDVKISILSLLPNATALKSIPFFLESISNQTEKALEIIFLSSEIKHDIIAKLAENHPSLCIRTINRPSNGHELYNAGLCAARGEFIFWSDISDKLQPDCITALLGEIEGQDNMTAAKCGYIVHREGSMPQTVAPLAYVREMIHDICDLRGLLYRRSLHNEIGIFKPGADKELGWDMCIRLGLIRSFAIIDEPLIVTSTPYQFNMQPDIESYHRIMHNTIDFMGNAVDMVRLYEDDFRRHQADSARYILEEEMHAIQKLICINGVEANALLRVPKTHLFDE